MCASGVGGPATLGPPTVVELRALLRGAPDDKWLLPFLNAVARSATTTQDGSAAVEARAAAGHVAMVVASMAAVGDGAYIRLLFTIASGCCAAKAAAASQGGGSGGHERGGDGSGGVDRWLDNVAAATVVLVGPDALGLERPWRGCSEASANVLSPTRRRLGGAGHLATLAARELGRDGPFGDAGPSFLASLPCARAGGAARRGGRRREPRAGASVAGAGPAPQPGQSQSSPRFLSRSPAVVDALLADPHPVAQLQGLLAVCDRDGPAAPAQVRRDLADSPLLVNRA